MRKTLLDLKYGKKKWKTWKIRKAQCKTWNIARNIEKNGKWEILTRVLVRPGKTQQTRIFCGKALLLTSSGARVQEAREQEARERENETPSLLRRIILRLGRVTPWLAAAHRPSWRHGEGRAHGVENPPRHMRRLFVYHLEHSCQRHLVTANVGAAPNNKHLLLCV